MVAIYGNLKLLVTFYRNDRNAPYEVLCLLLFEPYCEKTGLRGLRLGPTQTRLYTTTEDGFKLEI